MQKISLERSINNALQTLDRIEKSDSRLMGITHSGLLKRTPQKQGVEQRPVKAPTIQKPAPLEVQVKTVTQKPVREPLRWGQCPRHIGEKMTDTGRPAPVPATPSSPAARQPVAPSLAETLRASRNTTRLDGHQLAAQRAGLDVNTPNLDSMSFQDMQEKAHSNLLTATEPMFHAHGKCYRR